MLPSGARAEVRRARVDLKVARSMEDVQRFFMALRPGSRKGAPSRLVIIGKKRLPDVERHERFFCFLNTVAPTVSSRAELWGGWAFVLLVRTSC